MKVIGTDNYLLKRVYANNEDFMSFRREDIIEYFVEDRILIRNLGKIDILSMCNEKFLNENEILYIVEDKNIIPIGLFSLRESRCDYDKGNDGNIKYNNRVKFTYKNTDEYYKIPQILKNIEKAFMIKAEAAQLMDYDIKEEYK